MQNRSINILIVDDHQLVRMGLMNMLSAMPVVNVVAEAENASEALEILKKENFDLVFMDIKMPVMDGISATRIITAKYPSSNVVVLSVYDDEEYIVEAIKAGAKGYLLKNTDQHEIQKVIEAVTNGEEYVSKEVSQKLLRVLKVGKEKDGFELKDREKDVLYFLWLGLTSKEISKKLHLSTKSVDLCRSQLLAKMKCKNTIDLLRCATENGLIKSIEREKQSNTGI